MSFGAQEMQRRRAALRDDTQPAQSPTLFLTKGSRARLASQAFATSLEREPEALQLERGPETQSGSQAPGSTVLGH